MVAVTNAWLDNIPLSADHWQLCLFGIHSNWTFLSHVGGIVGQVSYYKIHKSSCGIPNMCYFYSAIRALSLSQSHLISTLLLLTSYVIYVWIWDNYSTRHLESMEPTRKSLNCPIKGCTVTSLARLSQHLAHKHGITKAWNVTDCMQGTYIGYYMLH